MKDHTLWPAAALQSELRSLNRAFLQDSTFDHLRGRDAWPNQMLDRLREELALAEVLQVIPIGPAEAKFEPLMKSEERFNWAIRLDGTLKISPSNVTTEMGIIRISHAILAVDGGDVLAAGEGKGDEYLSHTTGHYKNEMFVVEPVRRAFGEIGFQFRR